MRPRLATSVLLVGLTACTTGPVQLSPTPGDAASLTTNAALGMFGQVCVAGAGTEPAMQAQLSRFGFAPVPPAAAVPFLVGTPGTAWLRADPASVSLPVAVVTRPGGVFCQIMSPLSAPAQATAGFRALIEGLASAGPTIRTERDTPLSPDGQAGHQLIYRVAVPGGSTFRYAMSVRAPMPGGLALLMTASRAGDE